jgi:hypothetical protein
MERIEGNDLMATTYKVNGRKATKAEYDAARARQARRSRTTTLFDKPPAQPPPKAVVPAPPTVQKFPEAKGSVEMPNFLAELNKDGHSLPSRYEVLITPPAGHPNKNSARVVSMRVEAIDLPGRALNTSLDTNMYGIAPEIVDGITFAGTIALTIQTGANLEERVFFQSWQELAWNRVTWNVGYYKNYIGSMEIYVLDINNNRRYGVKIFDCFPKEVGPVALSYNQATEIIKTSVTMQYKYWESADVTNQPAIRARRDLSDQGATRVLRGNIPASISTLRANREGAL